MVDIERDCDCKQIFELLKRLIWDLIHNKWYKYYCSLRCHYNLHVNKDKNLIRTPSFHEIRNFPCYYFCEKIENCTFLTPSRKHILIWGFLIHFYSNCQVITLRFLSQGFSLYQSIQLQLFHWHIIVCLQVACSLSINKWYLITSLTRLISVHLYLLFLPSRSVAEWMSRTTGPALIQLLRIQWGYFTSHT